MNKYLVSDRHPLVSLLYIFVIVAVGFLFLGPAIGLLIASPFYEGDLFSAIGAIGTGRSDPVIFTALMVVQGTAGLLGLIAIPLLYLTIIERKPVAAFFKKEKNMAFLIGWLILTGLCVQIALAPVIEWNMHVTFPEFLRDFERWARQQEDALMHLTRFLTTFPSVSDLILGLVVIAVIPGIGEEFVFRGLIQNEFYRSSKNIHLAIWLSAFLFSAIHMQFFGFVPRMLLGALFGYLYYWSGNLLVPMLAHFFHNGFSLLMIYLYQQGISSIDPESTEAAPLHVAVVCAVAVVGLLFYFRKLYGTKTTSD